MKPKFISVAEFTRLLGIGRTKAYELFAQEKVETVSIGRRRLVSRKSAESYAASLLSSGGSK